MKQKNIWKVALAFAVALAFVLPGAAFASDEKLETDTCPDLILDRTTLDHGILDPGDILFNYDVQGPSGDIQCVGVEFDGTYFYVTGGGQGGANKIHFFQANGTYITSVNQGTTSSWGWRDIGYDGNHMYSGDEDGIVEWYVTGLPDNPVLNKVGTTIGPLETCRAMAYDPDTDHFWTANWDSYIFEFERNGNIVNYYPNDYDIYGMAWDNVSLDGPWLWIFSQGGQQILQFDPIDGVYTGIIYYGPGIGIAGGACFIENWEEKGVFVGLTQSEEHDSIFGMEIFANPPPEPILEIGNITGELGKIKSSIKNIGTGEATDVEWSIALEGGLIILGKNTTGTETTIAPEDEAAIESSFIFGIGKPTITIYAECAEGKLAEGTATATVILFFIFNIDA